MSPSPRIRKRMTKRRIRYREICGQEERERRRKAEVKEE